MSAGRLLAQYERIADTPDAIGRLRRFILDLAVRGKLVPQNPRDEPASELLERIAAEKMRLMKDGEIKKEKPLPEIEPDEVPFPSPRGWEWVRVRKVTSDRGQMIPDQDFTYIDVTAINKEIGRIEGATITSAADAPSRARKIVRKGDVLYSCVRPYLLNIAIVEAEISPPPIASTAFAILNGFGLVMPRYQWIVLRSPFFVVCVEEKMRGQAYPAINDSDFSLLPFPLPPLVEQQRIVTKVNELMALCDRLEEGRAEREVTRNRLTASSLARLNAADPDTFEGDAHFVLNALPALTTRPDQIKQLRQTILNLAVRGKLVPQDSKDEPAAELLKRIAKEKARLVKAGQIRREQVLPPLSDADKSFDIADGWTWVRLGDLSQLVTSGSRDWAQHYSDEGAIFIRMGNLSKDHYRLRLDHIQHVNPPNDGEGTRTRLETGDILISITGDVGMLGLIPEGFGEAYINQHTAMFRPMPEMRGRYLAELFRSPFAQSQFNEPQRGIKNSFRLTDVTQFVVPLPPLAEQHRIVARVDELMALCDQLEGSLTDTAATRRRLLDALLAETLAPAESHEAEMADAVA
jgi:type I restriction enzyme S subunit